MHNIRPLFALVAGALLCSCGDRAMTDAALAPALEVAPAPALTLTLTATDDTIRVKPRTPSWIGITVRVESAGVLLSDSAAFTLSDPAAAKVTFLRVKRRGEVFDADSTRPSGRVFVRAQRGTARDSIPLWVETPVAPASAPATTGALVQVDLARRFQTISGWQAGGQGFGECVAWPRYASAVQDRLVSEMGITRLTVPLRTGSENDRDYYGLWTAGLISDSVYRASWHRPVNDNADPLVTDTSRFHFGFLDDKMTNEVLPLRARVMARGERFYLVLTVVDFLGANQTRPLDIVKSPTEYAELVTMAFVHLRRRFGFVPDALEVLLEPETTVGAAQSFGPDLGRALAAAKARLAGRGFTPEFLLPSTAKAGNAPVYFDGAVSAGGKPDWISYHRYNLPPTVADLRAIAARATGGVRSAMLEHIGSGIDDLLADLTLANVSAWMQFSGAFCGTKDNPGNAGVYYQVNQSDPSNPRINITNHAKLLRQVFAHVREGAVRVGAVSGDSTLTPAGFVNATGAAVVVVRTSGAKAFTVRGLPAGTYTVTHALDGGAYNVSQPTITKPDGRDVALTIPGKGALTIAGVQK